MSSQGSFEELVYSMDPSNHLPLLVVKMCDRWKVARTCMELQDMQCIPWKPGQPLPQDVLSAVLKVLET